MRKNLFFALPTVMLAGGLALAQEHGGKVDWIRDPEFGLIKAKLAKDLGDRKGKFLWVLELGKPETLKGYGAEAAPAVVVLDPKAPDPSAEPVARIAVREKDKPDVLNKALDEAAKKLKK
jgi:hypothetical protein